MQTSRPAGDPERAYKTLFDGPHAVFVLDVTPDGRFRILAFNAAEERLVGLSSRESAGKYVDDVLPPEPALSVLAHYRRCVEAGAPISYDEEIDVPAGHRHCATTLVPVRDDAGRVSQIIGVARDVTEERAAIAALRASEERFQEHLRQAQKLEAIGGLAAGVAHDFNNMLSVVLSYTCVLLDDLLPNDPIRADLEEVRKAGERGAELTRQLLAFSRKQVLAPTVVDLNRVIEGVLKMLTRVVGADVSVEVHAGRGIGSVYVDGGQIEQVLTNLVLNARDAMPRGGQLTIETSNVNVDLDASAALLPDAIAPGRYVVLSVADTGIGMDDATKSRLFEPFFTTKEKGRGTGLGLATAYGIVRQSGGEICVQSELGKGATFRIYLPRTDRTAEPPTSLLPHDAAVRGTETVLLVEDDEPVRAVMRSILRKHGYTVLDAQNGGEAFLICERFAAPIHLLLTDVVMPRMSGPELAARLAAIRPEMGVLYVSGYAEDGVHRDREAGLGAGITLLQKPITPAALLKKVRDVLDAAGKDKPLPR